jgi:diaminopimelate decarboxylase
MKFPFVVMPCIVMHILFTLL